MPHWLAPGFLWGAMWPNIFAPSAITLAAVIISHVRRQLTARAQHAERMTQADLHHAALKAHISETAPADLPEMTDAEFERRLQLWLRRDPDGFKRTMARLDRIYGRSGR